jgi:thiamine-phosphate pyrophosphorylase
MKLIKNIDFQFITNSSNPSDLFNSIEKVLESGCRWIQLRMKNASEAEVTDATLTAKAMCERYDATLIIDDYVDIAKKTGAHGVHLGKTDMPIFEARKMLDENFIIGATANNFDDIRLSVNAEADYIGLGPFRFTETKTNLSPTLGLHGYQTILNQCKRERITLPIIAIGGIKTDDIIDIMSIGVSGIALSSEILQSNNPTNKVHEIITTLNKHK